MTFGTQMIARDIFDRDDVLQHLLSLRSQTQNLEELADEIRDFYFEKCSSTNGHRPAPFVQALIDNALDNVDWLCIASMIC
jgi:hypothetical protein